MQQWYVKTNENQTWGPYTETQIIEKLKSGFFLGQELVSQVNEARWVPITKHQPFFDAIVDGLDRELMGDAEATPGEEITSTEEVSQLKPNEIPLWKKLQIEVPKIEEKTTPPVTNSNEGVKPPLAQEKIVDKSLGYKKILLFAGVAILAGLFILQEFSPKELPPRDRLRLRAVRFDDKMKNTKGNDEALKVAITQFRRHTTDRYVDAQNTLAGVLETNSSYLDAMGFLCMTYKELWPYSFQDSKDINAIYSVYRRASILKANSASAGVCYVIYLLTIGEYEKAKNYMEDALRREPNLLFFNQLMGDLLEQQKKYSTAIYYFQKVSDLWPRPPWAKPLLQSARTQRKLKKYSESLQSYQLALKYFPDHPWALLELGILQFEAFRQSEKANDLILRALSSSGKFPSEIKAEGYFVLAQTNLQSGYKKKALDYANQAFSIDSGNTSVKEFILNLGGKSALENVRIDSGNMLYLGTQYMKLGNYFAAQAEFRLAYEADPRNAIAAYHAGQSLWELNQSTEAIKWIEKSIHSDPGLISAYVTLSDYYARRHNYEGAAAILKNVQKRFPNNNEIMRGFANIEYLRGNKQAAIMFAQKALEIYPMDVGALQIIAKCHVDMNDYKSAYTSIWRSLEIDPHTPENHAIYSKVLSGANGANAAIEYLNQKIEEGPDVIIYRKALADIFIENKNWNGARTLLENILTLKKEDKETILNLAYVYQQEGYVNRALEMYLMAASFDPQDPAPLFKAGELYMEAGNYTSALAQFERVLRINKNFPKVYFSMGRAALESKNYEKALELAKAEKEMNPNIAEPYILAAQAQYKLENFSECASEYQKAILRRRQGTDIFIQMAKCYRLAGALDSAEQMLDKAAQLESGNAEIYREIGAVYHMQGFLPKAYSAYERYLLLSPNAADRAEIEKVMKELQ